MKLRKFFFFPLTRIIIGIIVIGFAVAIGLFGSLAVFEKIQISKDYKDVITNAAIAIIAFVSYTILYRFYEKRQITELKLTGFTKNAGIGFLVGFILQSFVILIIYIGGGYSILRVNPASFLLPGFMIALSSGIFEEILFRGIIFRLTEEKLGSTIAIIISALIFGLMHLANKNSSIYSAVAIAIEAGVLLAASYIYSKNLWLPIFLHFAWNFAEAGIYGAVISGNTINKSLFTSKFTGPDFLTGGAFGPENSIQAVLLCLAVGIIFIWIAKRQNKIVKPFWKK
ncbi:MAG TPA: CPBP family intramembrane glutamic endopeptidase [Ignavibacteriaceae bacterium]|nr:CPBP family intramembrane glutamic endopeptidase [Ignavibacteriaceae bacterium]